MPDIFAERDPFGPTGSGAKTEAMCLMTKRMVDFVTKAAGEVCKQTPC